METWLLILGIGIVIPAFLIVMAVVRRRAKAQEPPPPTERRSAEQQKALERRQSLGYTQNVERDL
jgi:hypothetical protein